MLKNLLVATTLVACMGAAFAQDPSSCIRNAVGHALADCAFGYGEGALGGKGGTNYVVTSALDDGSAGTLRGILSTLKGVAGGKWITFTQGQTFEIALTAVLDIKADAGAEYLTIDGRGANVTLTNYGINIFKTSHIIINDIAIKNAVAKEDLMQISQATSVWINQVTFSNEAWGRYPSEGSYPDGACDITNDSIGVTVSLCHFNNHNKTMLIGNSDSKSTDVDMRVTVALNHFGTMLGQRLPRMRWGKFDVANNWYEARELIIGGSSDPAALIRNNVFDTGSTRNIFYMPDTDAAVSFFVSDNLLLNGAVDNSASILHGNQSIFVPEYSWTPISTSLVQGVVSSFAGSMAYNSTAGVSTSTDGSSTTTTKTSTTKTTKTTTTTSPCPTQTPVTVSVFVTTVSVQVSTESVTLTETAVVTSTATEVLTSTEVLTTTETQVVTSTVSELCPTPSTTTTPTTTTTSTTTTPSTTSTSKTTKTSTKTTTSASPSPSPCAARWEQCGGIDFTGTKCCQGGYTCVANNAYYSKCI